MRYAKIEFRKFQIGMSSNNHPTPSPLLPNDNIYSWKVWPGAFKSLVDVYFQAVSKAVLNGRRQQTANVPQKFQKVFGLKFRRVCCGKPIFTKRRFVQRVVLRRTSHWLLVPLAELPTKLRLVAHRKPVKTNLERGPLCAR